MDVPVAPRGVPYRTCVGCRERRASHELVRVTRAHVAGDLRVDVDGPSRGRGAWLCRHDASGCLDLALARRQFDRAWRTKLTEPEHDALRDAVRRHEEQHRHG